MQFKQWPAAKYLTYAFWRSWILSVYTAPIWSLFSAGGQAGSPAFLCMYLFSTLAYVIVCLLCAVGYRKAARLLNRQAPMLALGIASSVGMVLEYVDLWATGGEPGALFACGAVLTGLCTAPISIRAGQIYARTRPTVAVSNTALSEVAAGLVYFLVVSNEPAVSLTVVAALPFLASLMSCLGGLDIEPMERGDAGTQTESRPKAALLRFLAVVFLVTFVAYCVKSVFLSDNTEPNGQINALGISLVVFVSFGIAMVCAFSRSFSFTWLYYPIVLLLGVACLVLFTANGLGRWPLVMVVCIYSLTSLFNWGMLSYAAQSDYWDPIEVFGFGRAAFALGSLTGLAAITWLGIGQAGPEATQALGIVFAAILVACVLVIFREKDIVEITNASWLASESEKQPNPADYEADAAGTSAGAADGPAAGTAGAPADMQATGAAGTSSSMGADMGSAGRKAAASCALTVDEYADDHNFTRREREVFPLMLQGRGSKSIAEKLVISDNTAKSHIRSIYAKCGVHTRAEFIEETSGLKR